MVVTIMMRMIGEMKLMFKSNDGDDDDDDDG